MWMQKYSSIWYLYKKWFSYLMKSTHFSFWNHDSKMHIKEFFISLFKHLLKSSLAWKWLTLRNISIIFSTFGHKSDNFNLQTKCSTAWEKPVTWVKCECIICKFWYTSVFKSILMVFIAKMSIYVFWLPFYYSELKLGSKLTFKIEENN